MTNSQADRRILLLRASQVVAHELRGMILRGELAHTDKLPTEVELAEQLGISRHHLREALRLLEQDGLVRIMRGHSGGIALSMPEPATLERTLEGILARQGTSLADLVAARAVVEPAVAQYAAVHATAEDLAMLEAVCDRRDEGGESIPENNRAFHLGVATAAHNQTLYLIVRSMSAIVSTLDSISTREDYHVAGAKTHRFILAAIRAGDGEKSKELMRKHILGFADRLTAFEVPPDQQTIAGVMRLAASIRNGRAP